LFAITIIDLSVSLGRGLPQTEGFLAAALDVLKATLEVERLGE
jgi:hypothetical protein